MKKRPNVALLIETSNSYSRGLLRGIHAYLREHRSWSIYLPEQGRGDAPPVWLKDWRGEGIIARIENPRIARAVKATGVPVIDVSAARLAPELPWVETDDAAIARLAADHLLERGFKCFGYCGDDRFNWSRWRSNHFMKVIAAAGHPCHVYQSQAKRRFPLTWEQEEKQLSAWIRRLPKPVGIMACYDIRGRHVLEICRKIGVAVPDEVAVLGVDNDELLCNLSEPPLSSIVPDTHRTGYEAAALLDAWMSGKVPSAVAHRLKPMGLVTRQSTDVLAIDDPLVSQAVRFIRDHACDGISVADVLRAVPLSRRVLEYRFKNLLGRSPHDEIMRTRFQRVTQLLLETDLSLATIADHAGFCHPEYLSVVFKQYFGVPPRDYRRRHRS